MSDSAEPVQEKKRGRATTAAAKKEIEKPEIKDAKKRGRTAQPPTKNNDVDKVANESNDEPASKRGRGRPPKGVATAKSNSSGSNKKKGKKSAPAAKKGGKTTASSGRGRPKKEEVKDENQEVEEEEDDEEEEEENGDE